VENLYKKKKKHVTRTVLVLSILLPQDTTERVIEAKSNEKEALIKFVGLRKWEFSILKEVFFFGHFSLRD